MVFLFAVFLLSWPVQAQNLQPYYLPIEASVDGFERHDKVVAVPVDQESSLRTLGANGPIDPASLHLVEVDEKGRGVHVAFRPVHYTVGSLERRSRPIVWRHLSSTTGDLPVPNGGTQQTASQVLDVDGDGDNDFVITDRSGSPSVVWYRRATDGWEKLVIDDTPLRIEAGGAHHDIDGDGDEDIVFGADASDNHVWWWENPHPNYDAPWPRHVIKNDAGNKHHDELFGDFDGDGEAELVFWNQRSRTLNIADVPDNPKSPQPWPYATIYSWDEGPEHEGLAAFDVDGDGALDIVGGGRWFKHRRGHDFDTVVIDDEQRFTRAAAGQFVPGGPAEIVFVPGDADGPLMFYQAEGDPTDPASWSGRALTEGPVIHGHSIGVGDIDGDGHLDIFNAEMHTPGHGEDALSRIFYGDGMGGFTMSILSRGIGNHESRLADLDGDGDLDVLTKPYTWDTPRVDVWLNEGMATTGAPGGWKRHLLDEKLPTQSMYIHPGDVNGDGHKDVIVGAWWYENPGSLDGSWQLHTIGEPLNNMAAVYDFDGDGDLDVLGTQGVGADANAEFLWARNDGAGRFTIHRNVPEGEGDFLQGVTVGRFSDDGPVEIALSWHAADQGVQMLTVPEDPAAETWGWRRISDASQDEDLSMADLDGDGDMDLYQGTQWLENPGDRTANWPAHKIGEVTEGLPDRNDVFDFDSDGNPDAVVGLENGDDVLLYLSGEDPKQPWTRRLIDSGVGGGFSMDAGDVDGDGDPDVVLGEHRGEEENRLIFYENIRSGADWRTHVIDRGPTDEIDHHDGSLLVDMDADGDLDVISVGWYNPKVWIFENLGR